jgi:hypothetical protein
MDLVDGLTVDGSRIYQVRQPKLRKGPRLTSSNAINILGKHPNQIQKPLK